MTSFSPGSAPGADRPGPAGHQQQYYDRLWAQMSHAWRTGQVHPVPMRDGQPVPVDYCVSTVARLVSQRAAPVAAVQAFAAELRERAPGQYFYPLLSQHVTLLGCTQRDAERKVFTRARVDAIKHVCETVLRGERETTIHLEGVCLSGPQVFVQGYCEEGWPQLRARLGDALAAIGEQPMTYPNKWPCHCNVMRYSTPNPGEISAILELVGRHRGTPFGTMRVRTIDLLLTDFVLSAPGSDYLAEFHFHPV